MKEKKRYKKFSFSLISNFTEKEYLIDYFFHSFSEAEKFALQHYKFYRQVSINGKTILKNENFKAA